MQVPPFVHDVLDSAGRPLEPAVRASMESGFRHDFSRVRVHTDRQAAAAAAAVNAAAFTVGEHIVFGEGAYAPTQPNGKYVLAHELSHIRQQAPAMSRGLAADQLVLRDDPSLERDAETAARRVTSGMVAGEPPILRSELAVQRQTRASRTGGSPRAGGSGSTYFHCRTPTDHKHRPAHDWARRQPAWARRCANVERGIEGLLHGRVSLDERDAVECICGNTDPRGTLETARRLTMFPGGLASQHVDHYLSGGGSDFHEDLRNVLLTDAGVRAKLANAIRHAPRGCVSIEQSDYASHDFKFAFGGIDRMDYQVDPPTGTVSAWFRDRYEWHPEDVSRPSNCVHRAAVELKDSGAADYWMVGSATVPLSWFTAGPTLWERIFE